MLFSLSSFFFSSSSSHRRTSSGRLVLLHSSHVCTRSLLPSCVVEVVLFLKLSALSTVFVSVSYHEVPSEYKVIWAHSRMSLYVIASLSQCLFLCLIRVKAAMRSFISQAYRILIDWFALLQVPVMMQWAVQWCWKSSTPWPTSPLLFTTELFFSLMEQRKISCR